MKKISQLDWPTGDTSCHGKQISVHTRELAPETDSCNRFAPGACSLISNQFDMREQNSGAKVSLRSIFFRLKSLVQTRELCSGSVSQECAAGVSSLVCTDLKRHLLNALNYAYSKGLLSITQRRGLITLIPKKNKPTNLMKNWRPITLLNCDYKIATKCIASRIKKVLPKLINNDQTGFMKNRFIGENIRLIDSIINYANTEQIEGLLLFIDFEKAFDSIEWSFIEKTLKYYSFGNSLITWIKLFYTDMCSCVQNNGWSSDFFTLSRGVRQGCPPSPYLFILCAEILANAVRNDPKVRGIKVFDTECKISQYADDTTFILDGSQSSFSRSLYLLDTFALISGLKVNYDKTEALWIGSRKGSQIIFPSGKLYYGLKKRFTL